MSVQILPWFYAFRCLEVAIMESIYRSLRSCSGTKTVRTFVQW